MRTDVTSASNGLYRNTRVHSDTELVNAWLATVGAIARRTHNVELLDDTAEWAKWATWRETAERLLLCSLPSGCVSTLGALRARYWLGLTPRQAVQDLLGIPLCE